MHCEQLSYSYHSSPAAKFKLLLFGPKSYPAKYRARMLTQQAAILKKLNLVSKPNLARPPKPKFPVQQQTPDESCQFAANRQLKFSNQQP